MINSKVSEYRMECLRVSGNLRLNIIEDGKVLDYMHINDQFCLSLVNQELKLRNHRKQWLMVSTNFQLTSTIMCEVEKGLHHYKQQVAGAINMFSSQKQKLVKINHGDKKISNRFVWVSPDFLELRWSKKENSKTYSKLQFSDVMRVEYATKSSQPMFDPYCVTLVSKEKPLHLVVLDFKQLLNFTILLDWILLRSSRISVPQFDTIGLSLLKVKLLHSALKRGKSRVQHLKEQLQRISTVESFNSNIQQQQTLVLKQIHLNSTLMNSPPTKQITTTVRKGSRSYNKENTQHK